MTTPTTPADSQEAPWIHCIGDIPGASVLSLRRAILTIDGRGVKLKAAALDELFHRQQLEKIGKRLFPEDTR